MPRLFTGVEIPRELQLRLAALRSPLPGAKWVEVENLHLTLRFFGDVDNRTAEEIADQLGGIECDCFELTIAGLGAFGGNDPKILWAGVQPCGELETLARANERAARSAGLPPEQRTFKAHVTLARMRHARADVIARFLERNARFALPTYTVERFALFSSRPKVGGGPYRLEEAYALAGACPDGDLDHEPAW